MSTRRVPRWLACATCVLAAVSLAEDRRSELAEDVKPYALDVTKPLSGRYEAFAELRAIDGFLSGFTRQSASVYLPTHIALPRSEQVLELVQYSCSHDLDETDCAPTFLSGSALTRSYIEDWLDPDAKRAVTNFVRRIVGEANYSARPLPMFERSPRLSSAGFYNELRTKEADDERRSSWFRDPCNLVNEAGRDEGWEVPERPENPDPITAAILGDVSCTVSDTVGSGLVPLSESELRALESWAMQKGYVFKNQPSPRMRGDIEDYRGKDLTRHAYNRQYPERYLGFLALRPGRIPQVIPSFFSDGKTRPADLLTAFEKQFLKRLIVEARREISKLDATHAAKLLDNIRIVFAAGGFTDVKVRRSNTNELWFPANALRASFLQCSAPVAELIRLTENERQCTDLGGSVREAAQLSWMRNGSDVGLDVLSGGRDKTHLEEAQESRRRFICTTVASDVNYEKVVDNFNACVTAKLWFLLHHELAHLYLRQGAEATEPSEDRADCYALRTSMRTRAKAGLGVFESGVIQELDNLPSESILTPAQISLIRLRHAALVRGMPLVQSSVMTDDYCDAYSSRPP